MSSIWDSLHVRSPSACFRDGALTSLAAAGTFLSFASSGMVAVLFLSECILSTLAHYRERLIEYDPPVVSTLIARCKSSTHCCISASVRSTFLLEQCRNEWMLAPVQSRTGFFDGAFSVST